ncbi:MAG: hypothetical protein M3Z29_06755 [Pseudomonadota bacterium]|nr:hypothetical protein [Pseudomonadota bacterium]
MITAVHWDVLANRTLFAIEAESAQLVIWPAPVQHDACLAEARSGASPTTPRLRGRTAVLRTAAECLADAAENDNFLPCVVDVVDKDSVTAATGVSSDGHPLFWIGLRRGRCLSTENLMTCVAAGLSAHRTTLRWDVLPPAPQAQSQRNWKVLSSPDRHSCNEKRNREGPSYFWAQKIRHPCANNRLEAASPRAQILPVKLPVCRPSSGSSRCRTLADVVEHSKRPIGRRRHGAKQPAGWQPPDRCAV